MPLPLDYCLSDSVTLNRIEDCFYLTYPHSNGFLSDEELLLLKKEKGVLSIHLANLSTFKEDFLHKGEHVDICSDIVLIDWLPCNETEIPYVDCQRGSIVSVVGNCLYLWRRIGGNFIRTRLYSGSAEERLDGLCSIDRSAQKVLFSVKISDKHYRACELLISTKQVTVLLELNYYANHFHYSPADPRWFAFSHEGGTLAIADRIHTWNRTENPDGKCSFNQHRENGTFLSVGHERCCFHDKSMVVVAYGASKCGPRGIYEVFFDGRAPVLISEGERDWHVNISESGRYCVVDTTAPTALPGKGWQNANGKSEIILIKRASGERKVLTQSLMEKKHPWHPHPCFSPDEKWIFYNQPISAEAFGRNQIKIIYIGNL